MNNMNKNNMNDDYLNMLKNYFLLYKYLKLAPRKINYLISAFENIASINKLDLLNALRHHQDDFNLAQLSNEKNFTCEYQQFLKEIKNGDIRWLHHEDPIYTNKMNHIASKPHMVFYKGNIGALRNHKSVAIVGSRKPSQYGLRVAFDLAKFLAENGVNVISGLAAGIDGAAHRGALKGRGVTAAVMATGALDVYPKHHRALYQDILNGNGVVISEKPAFENARKYDFPYRNRLISALSDVVVIIEASQKSGSLITAKYAVEQGKTVFALPGNIFSENSHGTNQLIFDGAAPLIDYKHVLESMAMSNINHIASYEPSLDDLSENSKKVFQLIKKFNIIEINEISMRLDMEISIVNACLSELIFEDLCTFCSLTEIQCSI